MGNLRLKMKNISWKIGDVMGMMENSGQIPFSITPFTSFIILLRQCFYTTLHLRGLVMRFFRF